jgi:pimeloyl-ACP methyl ester carboxylesterase
MAFIETAVPTPFGRLAVWQSRAEGFPLLLIHGSSTSKAAFRQQFDSPLAARFRLIAVDLPGHGGSDDAPRAEDYAIPRLAEAVGAVPDALGLDRFAIYGWSLGGHVGIEMLARYPAICGLMLGGAPPIGRGPLAMLRAFHTGWDMLLVSKGQFTPHDVDRFGRMCFGDGAPDEFLDDIRRADGRCRVAVARSMLRGEGADQRRTVETATVPVAFVNGEHERILRLSYLDSLDCPTLWDGRSHLVPDSAHAPFFQNPQAFNALLQRFLDSAAEQAADAAMAEDMTASTRIRLPFSSSANVSSTGTASAAASAA